MKSKFLYICFLFFCILNQGCKKDFLDQKPDKALLVPTTLTDFQSLLDNLGVMNTVPGIERIATDDLEATLSAWQNYQSAAERNSYIWAKDVYQGQSALDWSYPYQQIFYANVVLDGLDKLDENTKNSVGFRSIKGGALFFRASAYYYLAQLFTRQYQPATAASDPGVPLHLSSDVNLRPGRGTVQNVYDRVLTDLKDAAGLLPLSTAYKSRPSQPAAMGFLARVYLTMGDYADAEKSARQTLAQHSKLMDYNNLDSLSTRPFPASLPDGNDEVLFHAVSLTYSFTSSLQTSINGSVLDSYSSNDLRKKLFFYFAFSPYVILKNSYAGSAGPFAGIATDEVYLIAAESMARQNKVSDAMQMLNALSVTRYKKSSFIPFAAADQESALTLILQERRKELFTNQGMLRWVDLRRLNLDAKRAVTLKRTLGGKTYELPPNDNRYVFPIPDNEIQNSGIAQNPR